MKVARNECFASALDAASYGERLKKKHNRRNDRLVREWEMGIRDENKHQEAMNIMVRRAGFDPAERPELQFSTLDCLNPRKARMIIQHMQNGDAVIAIRRGFNHANALLPAAEADSFCQVVGMDMIGEQMNRSRSLLALFVIFKKITIYPKIRGNR